MNMQTLIEFLADGALVPVVLLGVYALIWRVPKGHRFEAYCRILMAGLTAYLIAKLLASVYQPSGERPFQILGVEPGASYLDNPGFPSDHVLFLTALTLAVWFETKAKTITIIMAVLTGLVALGRVLALVHTPLDVIGGALVAALGALWYFERIEKRATTNTRQTHKNLVQ